MWASTGRSGYGDSTIGGDYDSWDAISPNGRQYKNEATMETRDLSGADYWHLRKQNRPTEQIPASLHMLNKDRANIDAYAVLDAPVKRNTSIPLADRVLPQQRTLSKLIDQIKELEQAKRDSVYTQAEYDLLRDVLFSKKERAEYLLAKQRARKPKSSTQSDEALSHTLHTNAANQPKNPQQKRKFACNSAVRDAMLFLGGSLALLVMVKVIF